MTKLRYEEIKGLPPGQAGGTAGIRFKYVPSMPGPCLAIYLDSLEKNKLKTGDIADRAPA
jgi:hypothetical protein